MENKEYFHKLFDEIEEMEVVDNHEEDWFNLEKKLETSSFFRFKWRKFNIYYAGLIVATFLLSTVTSLHYLYHVHEYSKKERFSEVAKEVESAGNVIKSKNNIILTQSPDTSKNEKKSKTNHASGFTKEEKYKGEGKDTKGETLVKESSSKKNLKSSNSRSTLDSGMVYQPSVAKNLTPGDTVNSLKNQNRKVPDTTASPIVKKVFVVKQDTILKYDSVKVKPQFRLFGKKRN